MRMAQLLSEEPAIKGLYLCNNARKFIEFGRTIYFSMGRPIQRGNKNLENTVNLEFLGLYFIFINLVNFSGTTEMEFSFQPFLRGSN